jgi:hypothetical protein
MRVVSSRAEAGITAETSLRLNLPALQAKYVAAQITRKIKAARIGTRKERRSSANSAGAS